jgi:DNA transformation protein
MDDSFRAFVEELFEPVGGVGFRRMFGGLGIFRDGLMFALVARDTLYFKTDEASRLDFTAEGCGPFVYQAKDGQRETSYWRAPERLFDEPEDFRTWAMTAFAVAERSKERRKPSRPSRPAAKTTRTRSAGGSGGAGSSARGRRVR